MFKNRASWLDQIVYAFQHRWETNPQYRAAVSGVVGLALVITMCACTGVVSAATSAALAGIGLGGSGAYSTGGSLGTGTNRVKGAKSFPTPTVVLAPGAGGGVSQLPNSQTPIPHPTAIPTATRDTSGGGGPNPPGTIVTTCNGAQGSASWVLNPCPLVSGQSGTLTIVDKKHPGASTNVVIDFCSASSCAQVYPPSGGYKLDGSGIETISFTVPDQAANSTTPVNGMINVYPVNGGSYTMSILAAPVQ